MGSVVNATTRLLFSWEKAHNPTVGLGGYGEGEVYFLHRDSSPRSSSPWRVSIPTGLSQPLEQLDILYIFPENKKKHISKFVVLMRTTLLWGITQRVVEIYYRRFGLSLQ